MKKEIIIKRYSPDMAEQWNAFCAASKTPLFMFNRNYMDYHQDRFADHSLLFYADDELIALLPANEKDQVLFSHGGLTYGGLITNTNFKQHISNDCFSALVAYAKENNIQKILYKCIPHIFHVQPAEEATYSLFLFGGRLLKVESATVLNLKAPLKMPKGRKAQISRAKREGVVVQELCRKADYEAFIALENEVLQQHHGATAVHTADELYLLHQRFPENIRIFGAFIDNVLIAGTVIYEYGHLVHTQYLAANDTARTIGALDLVISTVMERYRESKQWLDFGISTENGGRVLNEGLIAQKEGFGGRTNVYVTWELDI